jgi:5'-nucleotidase
MASLPAVLLRATRIAAVGGALALAAPAGAADYKLTILHVNDLQSRLEPVNETGAPCTPADIQAHHCAGGMARLAARIASERATAPNVLVVDAGNAFTGTPIYDMYKHRAISETMNLIGFDAMTVGDREFVDGTEMLSRFQQSVRFPLLGANVDVQSDPYMKDRIYPILVTERGGDRVGLVGYSNEHLIERANPKGVVYVQRIEAALDRWVKQIQMMGVNKIIAVSHAGFERDRQVAASTPGIDVIVGDTEGAPAATGKGANPTVLKGVGGQSVLLVHAGEFGRSLGRLDVTFDGKGVPKHWQAATIELTDDVAEDQRLKDLVASLAAAAATRGPIAPTTMR